MKRNFNLERYPPVELRSDLGELLIQNEEELVLDSMDAVREVIQLRAKDKNNIGRGDHAKPLGCYRAEFTISPPDVVRPDDRAGIAKSENLGRTFGAVVRFSNSEPKDVSDYRSATTGLAIKVMLGSANHPEDEFLFGRSGEQDFIGGGFKTFVSSTITDYADLFRRRIHPFSNALHIKNAHPEGFTAFATKPFLRLFRPTSSAAPMVLEERFSSLLPYAWGHSAVKYRFEPCHVFERNKASFSRFDSGYQAKVLTEFLQSKDICYVMKIQVRPRPGSPEESAQIEKTFPIEDAKVLWPERAEFREVARVRIQKGSKAMPDDDCERLAFNPWNGLKAHQPLGSLSRARWAVYKESELVRKELYPPEERK
jgi:hypothetical protein